MNIYKTAFVKSFLWQCIAKKILIIIFLMEYCGAGFRDLFCGSKNNLPVNFVPIKKSKKTPLF